MDTGRYSHPIWKRYENVLIVVVGIIAIVRIFVFSAAFPFFNNVDEQFHFDTVVNYAHGYLPGNGASTFNPESAKIIAGYGTPEYFHRESAPVRRPFSAARENEWLHSINYEEHSSPVYYMCAGAWYNLGRLFGLQGGYLLYWIRFMNMPVYALFLWVAYLFCRDMEPDNQYLRIGVMLLLSFFPQNVFYSINSDVMSPLFFICGLFLLARIYGDNRSWRLYPLAGIMIAGTVLVKLSNLPALLIFSIMIGMLVKKIHSTGHLAVRAPNIVAMLAALAVPLVVWIGVNLYTLGDMTGASEKINYWGWTVKPFREWGNHPIFTIQGMYLFLSELARSFWRGELIWHLERLASKSSDGIYLLTTLIFGTAGIAAIIAKRAHSSSGSNFFNYLHIGVMASYISFLVLLSIRYDFGDCPYPSNEFPYFASGRLILATLVSFLTIYVKGVEFIAAKISRRIDPMVVIFVIVLYSAFSEISIFLERGIFASPYNFFHL